MRSTSIDTIYNSSTKTSIPQIDGSIDNDDEDNLISSTLLNSLIQQIIIDENNLSVNNERSIHSPRLPAKNATSQTKLISSNELIDLYQQWSKSKFGRIKFTITSDDGYKIVSENLDDAWSTIVNLVSECRDDMNLTHLPMTSDQLNGHRIFGLTKTIVKIMLNQVYISSLSTQEQANTIILPLSSTSNKHNSIFCIKKKVHNKNSSASSRSNIYQRKSSQRQRFSWLSNPNKKIEYTLRSFEIDDALAHAR